MTVPRVRGAQLITYADGLGGDLGALARWLDGPLGASFPAGVHLLPPFPSSGDRGFAPLNYDEIDPRLGTWEDVARVAGHGGLMLDVMVNHLSRRSPEFQAFQRDGRDSPTADLFLTLDKIWPGGQVPPGDLARIFLRKPEHPFSDVTIEATGAVERIWTSFGPRAGWSEQIDLDLNAAATQELIGCWFAELARRGATELRLDAVGYVTKRAGTSCFFVEPEIWDQLERLTKLAAAHGIAVLPEVHAEPHLTRQLADRGYWVYDFALPALVLHALITADATALARHLRHSPSHQVTTLDTHDGIPIQPDLTGILSQDQAQLVVDHCLANGANLNRVLPKPGVVLEFDAHQVNCTYRDAVGDDDGYLMARTIQLFAPGRPQIYYVGYLGGANDDEAVARSGEGRAINRHNFTDSEIAAALATPVVARLVRALDLHNHHPAFAGPLAVDCPEPHRLVLARRAGDDEAILEVDLASRRASIEQSGTIGPHRWTV